VISCRRFYFDAGATTGTMRRKITGGFPPQQERRRGCRGETLRLAALQNGFSATAITLNDDVCSKRDENIGK
jgi:hypothetical protein